MRRTLLALSLFGLTFGCGSSHALENDWSDEPVQEQRRFRDVQTLDTSKVDAPPPSSAWVGVRHDVALSPRAPHAERCACLAAAVGPANDPKFQWQAEIPKVGGDAEVIAMTARGVACSGGPPEDGRRASISAVDRENDDVVVEIEELPAGRPLASGAIIPRPGPNGAVYVRPKNKAVPYARGNGPGGRCRVD